MIACSLHHQGLEGKRQQPRMCFFEQRDASSCFQILCGLARVERQQQVSPRSAFLAVPQQDHDDAGNTLQYKTIPKYKSVNRRDCELLSLTWNRNWVSVVDRCEQHPEEARCKTQDSGRTALHLAMFNQGCPDYVARALLSCNPHASMVQDESGYTPLHYACLFKCDVSLIRALAQTAVTVEKSTGGKVRINTSIAPQSPLYFACKLDACAATIQALLSCIEYHHSVGRIGLWIAPITGGEPYWYKHDEEENERFNQNIPCPLIALWEEHDFDISLHGPEQVLEMRDVATHILNDHNNYTEGDDSSALGLWGKSISLVVAAWKRHAQDGPEIESACLLHAIASIQKGPLIEFLRCAVAVFPEALNHRDDSGLIPLHHIIRLPSVNKDALCTLLEPALETAKISTRHGEYLPIIMAIKSFVKWEEGLKELIMAWPGALKTQDAETRLYPYLVAASNDADVTTIFQLVTENPEPVGYHLL